MVDGGGGGGGGGATGGGGGRGRPSWTSLRGRQWGRGRGPVSCMIRTRLAGSSHLLLLLSLLSSLHRKQISSCK